MAHIDESTHGLEGTGATGQEMSSIVGLQQANEVGTLRLQNTHGHTDIQGQSLNKNMYSSILISIDQEFKRPI